MFILLTTYRLSDGSCEWANSIRASSFNKTEDEYGLSPKTKTPRKSKEQGFAAAKSLNKSLDLRVRRLQLGGSDVGGKRKQDAINDTDDDATTRWTWKGSYKETYGQGSKQSRQQEGCNARFVPQWEQKK